MVEEQPQSCWMPFCEQMPDNLPCPGSPPALSLEDCLRSPSAYCQVQVEVVAAAEAEASAVVGDSMSSCDWKIFSEQPAAMISSNVFYQSSFWLPVYIDLANQARVRA